jgi:hypothetical protein
MGFSLGEYDGTMFNLSAVIETNKTVGNGFHLNGKAWFGRKFGLGVSYRSQEVSGARVNKLIPMAEFQVSDAIRLGASYDSKPPTYQTPNSSSNFKQNAIMQIYFRYEGLGNERGTNRLKYY